MKLVRIRSQTTFISVPIFIFICMYIYGDTNTNKSAKKKKTRKEKKGANIEKVVSTASALFPKSSRE